MTPKLRVAFIGAGRIADLHALGYRENPDAEIYAVCDADGAWAQRRARQWGAKRWFTDYRQALADPSVDAVETLTPHHLHQEHAVAALQAGKHVSLQKPMARNLEEADVIVRAAAQSGHIFRVFENNRYYPPYVRAKALLEAGEIGEPVTLRLKVIGGNPAYGWPVPAKSWAWRFNEALSGGGTAMFDHGYHMFSIAQWFFGPVEEVFGWIHRTEVALGVSIDSPAVLLWRHRQGGRLGVWDTVNSPHMVVPSKYYSNDEWVEITGTHGLIWVNRCTGNMLQRPPLVIYRDGETREVHDVESDWAASFAAGTRDWIEAVRRGGQPELSATEAREVLRFSLAAHTAARENRPVRLQELG